MPRIKETKERKSRRVADQLRRWIEDLRRRQMQAERNRRRKWLLFLFLALLESKPVQAFFSMRGFTPLPVPRQMSRQRKSQKEKAANEDMRTDDERRYLYDYAPRRGEESAEVMDGLTWTDIVALNRIYRPHLFRTAPIPGMPDRYKDKPPHVWTLLDHIGSDYHRKDALAALKLLVDGEAHDWIDACGKGANGSSWKDLRTCRQRTPDMTISDFPRAAAWWRETTRREAEENLKNRPKPDGDDNGLSSK
jgi:hypothetical protein